jgi:hypothetical protein
MMTKFPKHIKIISGGQTGVDRAALDFALIHDIPCGGWCPKGRKAEDGTIAEKYPLKETSTSAYPERTRKNIEESDGTLIFYDQKFDPGTALTLKLCKQLSKPYKLVNLATTTKIEGINDWLNSHEIRILNFAGPRASFSAGIYDKTCTAISIIFERFSQ